MMRRVIQPWIILCLHYRWTPRGRCVAARWLGRRGTRRAVKPLVKALRDRSPMVRAASAESLGRLGRKKASKALISAVTDKDPSVRIAAVRSLGMIGAKRGLLATLGALGQSELMDRAVKSATINIGRRSPRSLIKVFSKCEGEAARIVVEVMAIIGDARFAKPLIRALEHGDAATRRSAAKALGSVGWLKNLKHLVGALDDGDYRVRVTVVESIGELRRLDSMTSLIEMFHDRHWKVRQAASVAVAKLGSDVYESVAGLLSDTQADVRACAVETLGQLGDCRARDSLVIALRDPSGLVRAVAVEALGDIEGPKALSYLLTALSDDDELVRMNACEALGKLGCGRAVVHLNRCLDDQAFVVRDTAMRSLRALGQADMGGIDIEDRETTRLLIALASPSKRVRLDAVRRISTIEGNGAVDPLSRMVEDDDPTIRVIAIQSLGAIGDRRSITRLRDVLRGASQPVFCRVAAAEALGKIGGSRSYVILVNAFSGDTEAVRAAALRAALTFDEPLLEPAIDIIEGAEPETLCLVAKCLSKQNDRRAIVHLCELSKHSDWTVRSAAARSLGSFGEDATEPLAALLDDPSASVRAVAVSGLGRLGVDAAIEPVFKALYDRQRLVRRAATEAMADLPSPRGNPRFFDLPR